MAPNPPLPSDCATYHMLDSNVTLYSQNDPNTGLWVLEAGFVKVLHRISKHDTHILRIAGPSDWLNVVAVLDGFHNPATAVTLGPVAVWHWASACIDAAIRSTPSILPKLGQAAAETYRQLVTQASMTAVAPAIARVTWLLQTMPLASINAREVPRRLIAAHLGLTAETLSRTLRRLEDLGAIEVTRTEIRIRDSELLTNVPV